MQVFRCFFTIVRKNLAMMVMYAAIFIGISLTLGRVIPDQTASRFEEERLPVTVIDRDGGEASRALADYLYERQEAAPLEDDEETVKDALYRRATWYVLYIPAGYEASLSGGEPMPLESAQVPGSYQTEYIDSQIKAYAGAVQAYAGAGLDLGEAMAAARQDAAVQVHTRMNSVAGGSIPMVYRYFIYLCYGLGMVMIFGLAPVLLAMGRRELRTRINGSALSLRRRNAELFLAAVVLAAVCFAAFMLIALMLYRSDFLTGGGLLCVLNACAYLLFSTALALLIGQTSKNSNMISAVANVIIMGMCFMGGIYVSSDLLGPAMQTVAKFLPTYWYAQAVYAAADFAGGASASLRPFWEGVGMQLVFTAAIVSVALVVSKRRQRIG